MLVWGDDNNKQKTVKSKKQGTGASWVWRVEEANFYMMISYTQGYDVIITKYENPKKI